MACLLRVAGMGELPWHLECHHHFPHPSGHHALFIRYSYARHSLTYAGHTQAMRYSYTIHRFNTVRMQTTLYFQGHVVRIKKFLL